MPNAERNHSRAIRDRPKFTHKEGAAMLKPLLTLVVMMLVATQITFAQGPMTLRVAGPPNEGYKDVYYAIASGLFAKYGIEVEPRITNGGGVVLAGLAGGSYDIAYTNIVPVLQAHLHG